MSEVRTTPSEAAAAAAPKSRASQALPFSVSGKTEWTRGVRKLLRNTAIRPGTSSGVAAGVSQAGCPDCVGAVIGGGLA